MYNLMMLTPHGWTVLRTYPTREEAQAQIPNDKRDPANGVNVPMSYILKVQEAEG